MAEVSSQAVCAMKLSTLDEPTVITFIDDTIHYLKGNKVPFLSKYSDAFDNQARLIVPCRDFLQDIIQLVLRRSTGAASSVDGCKQAVSDFLETLTTAEPEATADMSFKFAEMIAISVFARRNELVRVLSELVFRQSVDSYLLDYNYNIETVLSSDSFSK